MGAGELSDATLPVRGATTETEEIAHVAGLPEMQPGEVLESDAASSHSILRLTAVFAGSNMVSTVLRLVGGLLVSRAVVPSVLGLFNGINLVVGYVPFLQLGVINGLNRDLPYHLGRGDRPHATKLAAAAQAWALLTGGVAGLAMVLVSIWQASQGAWQLAFGWLTVSLPVFMAIFGQMYLQALFRTRSEFERLGKYNLIQALVAFALVALVWPMKFYGLCLRGMLIAASSLLLLWYWRPLKVEFRWDGRALKELVRTGVPVFAVGQFYSWWGVLDSTLVLKFAGTTGLGLYALSGLAGKTVGMVSNALGQVVYPRMSEEYGKGSGVGMLVRMAWFPVVFSVLVTGILGALGWTALPLFVRIVLPKYLGGVEAARWTLVSALVVSLMPINNVFNVVKRQDLYGAAMGIGIFTYLGGVFLLGGSVGKLAAFPQAMVFGRLAFFAACAVFLVHLWRVEQSN